MALLTSVQSGNASDSSTWGGSIPQAGDDLKRTPGHVVTFSEDTPSLGAVTVDATGTDSGGFVVAEGVTLTCASVAAESPGYVQCGAGSVIDITGSAEIALGIGWWQSSTAKLVVNGTLSKPVTIACSGTAGTIAPTLGGGSLKLEGTGYCKFQNIAGATFDRGADLAGPVTFDSDCGPVAFTTVNGDDFELNGCTHYGSIVDFPSTVSFWGNSPQTGDRIINGLFVPKGAVGWYGQSVWTVDGGFAAAHGYLSNHLGTIKNWMTEAHDAEAGWCPWFSRGEDVFVYAAAETENPHGWGFSNSIGRDVYFRYLAVHLRDTVTSPQYDLGDVVFIPDFAYTLTVERSIELPNAGGVASWRNVVGFGGASSKCIIDGCEVLGGHNLGETYAGAADMVKIKNQILRSTGSHCWFQNGNAVDNIVESASHGASIASAADPWNETSYAAKYRGLDKSSDITSDPNYVDGDLNIDDWAVSLGCTETTFAARAAWAIAAIKAGADPWSADYVDGATTEALFAFIRAGRTPQNADYEGGAGGDFQAFIGPVEPVIPQSSSSGAPIMIQAIKRLRMPPAIGR